MLTRADQPVRDEAAEQLRAFIADRGYGPGDRIPPERRLIDLLGISRAALRRALGGSGKRRCYLAPRRQGHVRILRRE